MTAPNRFLQPIFDSFIFEAFLMGIYHSLFAQAMWKLFRRRAHTIYVFALILLWATTSMQMICDWLDSSHAFVVANSSPESIDEAYWNYPLAARNFATVASFIISDSIVIWRSHVLVGKHWASAILIGLMLASAACLTASAFPISPGFVTLLRCVGLVGSAIATISSTVMIAMKIIIVTKGSGVRFLYAKVISIMVQSAALVSFMLLAEAVVMFLGYKSGPIGHKNLGLSVTLIQFDAYTTAVLMVIQGIAPTLIAFRVSRDAADPQVQVDIAHSIPLPETENMNHPDR